MVRANNGQVCGGCEKKIGSELAELGEVRHIEVFCGFAISHFFVGALRTKGMHQIFVGRFWCVCCCGRSHDSFGARLSARFGKKSKMGSSCWKRRSPRMFSDLTPYDI